MAESSIPLEFPDYRRLTRTGETGRMFETRIRDAPKIYCPFIIKVGIVLGKSRNGVALSSTDLMEIAETSIVLKDDVVIDTFSEDPEFFSVFVRDDPAKSNVSVGQKVSVAHHDVTLTIQSIEDTCDDNSVTRRAAIDLMLNCDTLCDSVFVTVPQTWVIPDPEFHPRTSTLPLYPGSFWLTFFKSVWGVVSSASIVFGVEMGYVGLSVKFKEAKALRQCVLTLHDRYLVHPKEGYGMKISRIKLVRNAAVTKKAPISIPRPPPTSAQSDPTVTEAFEKLLEKVERLDRENQRLLALLMDEQTAAPDSEPARERSPRTRVEIPPTGLPPWRV